jgi:ribonuclease T1
VGTRYGKLSLMTSRHRLIAVAVLICCAIAAAAVYAMTGQARAPLAAARPAAGRPAASWLPTSPANPAVCRSKLPSQAQDTLG